MSEETGIVEAHDPKVGGFICKHLAFEMDTPKTKPDIESFYYYIYHENMEVFVDHEGDWFLMIEGKCSQLQSDNSCGISERQADECVQHDQGAHLTEVAKHHFVTEHDLTVYLKEHRQDLFKKLYTGTQEVAELKTALPKNPKPKAVGGVGIDKDDPCSSCISCCAYVNIIVDPPHKEDNVTTLLWYIYRENCELYFDNDGDWSVVLESKCYMLDPNGLCSVYERRPAICRQFSSDECHGENMDESVKHWFKTDKELMDYFSSKRPKLFKKLSEKVQKLH